MSAVVVASGLTRTFGSGSSAVRAVEQVTFEVAGGEVLLVLGPSGSGKTTLLSMLAGLLQPTAGEARVDGQLIDHGTRVNPSWRLRSIGFVFQSFNLMPALSATENAALPLRLSGASRRDAETRAQSILEQLGMAERSHLSPRVLSGGEKQRVSIARALVCQPRVILADEPTASLDRPQGRAAIELLTTLSRTGRQAAIVVTHDPRLEEFADRVLRIEDGRLTAAT